MADLRIYGGDPAVIASLEEIARVAAQLRNAANALEAAIWQFSLNPIPNLQLAFLVPPVAQRLVELANFCDISAAQYFSTEQQIDAWFQGNLQALQSFGGFLGPNFSPLAAVSGSTIATSVAALAVSGLTSLPSAEASSKVKLAVGLVPLLTGSKDLPQTLARLPLAVSSASAQLVALTGAVPAKSVAEHAQRLRTLYQTPGQIKIERYQIGSANQYVVYIPGTQVFREQSSNPLSAKANLYAMAGSGRAPSEQAVRKALDAAEIERSDRVLLVGHSQGALIAANIASENPQFKVSGLISFGGPIANRDLTSIPTLALENSADPVPGLGGKSNPLTQDLVTVYSDRPADSVSQAHSIDEYVATAIELQRSENPGLERILRQLELKPASGTASNYELFDLEDAQQGSSEESRD